MKEILKRLILCIMYYGFVESKYIIYAANFLHNICKLNNNYIMTN